MTTNNPEEIVDQNLMNDEHGRKILTPYAR